MSIDDAIERFSNYHPITREDQDAFLCAIECMRFARDFIPLCPDPETMKHAINLLNSFEYVFGDKNAKEQLFALISGGIHCDL